MNNADDIFLKFWTADNQILSAKDNYNPKLIGNKCKSLIELRSLGLRTPDFSVFAVKAFEHYLHLNGLWDKYSQLISSIPQSKEKLIEAGLSLREEIESSRFPESFSQIIQDVLKTKFKKNFAVRSSGILEDLKSASFAGAYETKLNVNPDLEDISAAIKACWSSAFGERVLSYCYDSSIALDQLSIAVIMQDQIPSETSGVVFTVNPTGSSDTEMIIESCFGLGEGLVSGKIDPDQYLFDWKSQTLKSSKIGAKKFAYLARPDSMSEGPLSSQPSIDIQPLDPEVSSEASLSESSVMELAATSTNLQIKFGFPVDIEWAHHQGKFYYLQVRPITNLMFTTLESEWTTADFKDGGVSAGPCTPFMWSLYKEVLEKSMPGYFRKIKLLDPASSSNKETQTNNWGNMFFCRPYWNLSAVKKCVEQLPGYAEREFDQDLGITPKYQGEGKTSKLNPRSVVKGIKTLNALKKSIRSSLDSYAALYQAEDYKLKNYQESNLTILTDCVLFRKFDQLHNEYFRMESKYFNHIYDNSNFSTIFREKYSKIKTSVSYLDLVSGLANISHINQNISVWNICSAIKADPNAADFWKKSNIDGLLKVLEITNFVQFEIESVREHLILFGHHGNRELDLTVECYWENPSTVLEDIKSSLKQDLSFI